MYWDVAVPQIIAERSRRKHRDYAYVPTPFLECFRKVHNLNLCPAERQARRKQDDPTDSVHRGIIPRGLARFRVSGDWQAKHVRVPLYYPLQGEIFCSLGGLSAHGICETLNEGLGECFRIAYGNKPTPSSIV